MDLKKATSRGTPRTAEVGSRHIPPHNAIRKAITMKLHILSEPFANAKRTFVGALGSYAASAILANDYEEEAVDTAALNLFTLPEDPWRE